MASIGGLDTTKLAKKIILFGLEDVLVPGKMDSKVDRKAVVQILENLLALEKAVPDFHFFVVSGSTPENAMALLKKSRLDLVCPLDHCFFVDATYIGSKEEVDKKIYQASVSKDPFFKDEFFKQVMIEKISSQFGVPIEKMVLVGNDLWFVGFYTVRFSKIDFALVKSALSWHNQKQKEIIRGLTYINRTWSDVRKLLTGGFPPNNLASFNLAVENFLRKELLTPQTLGAIADAKKKAAARRQNA